MTRAAEPHLEDEPGLGLAARMPGDVLAEHAAANSVAAKTPAEVAMVEVALPRHVGRVRPGRRHETRVHPQWATPEPVPRPVHRVEQRLLVGADHRRAGSGRRRCGQGGRAEGGGKKGERGREDRERLGGTHGAAP